MDWIKVKVSHVLYEYTDFSNSEFRAWIKIMTLTAVMEKYPSDDVLKQHINPRTLESLSKKLEMHSSSVEIIVKKVLEDVEYTRHLKSKNKSKIAEWRKKKCECNQLQLPVTLPVTLPDKIREDKIREDNSNTSSACASTIPPKDVLSEIRTAALARGVDWDDEIKKMDIWLAKNPKRKKTDRFIANWMQRADVCVTTAPARRIVS